jgi:hypothetical protein
MDTRTWGHSGIRVSSLGLDCWAIGGEWQDTDGEPLGRGAVDDGFRTRALAEENAGAMAYGPLTEAQTKEIDVLLGR